MYSVVLSSPNVAAKSLASVTECTLLESSGVVEEPVLELDGVVLPVVVVVEVLSDG